MVRWAFNFASWNPTRAELLTATSCIQQEEKDRIAKFVFLRDFKASLVGRLLMRKFVHDYTGVAYNEIRFIRDERGKPLLTFPENSELKFNVSHHGSFCVLAGHIGSSLLGVDVMKFERERHKDLDEYFRIMSRQFTRDEWDTITRSPQKYDQITMFYRHWSLKESYVKAVGVGITERLQNLSFKINTDKLNKVQITADTELHIYGEKANWFFEEMLLDDDHCVAVALDNKEFLSNTNIFKFITFNELTKNCISLLDQDEVYCDRVLRSRQ